MVEMQHEISQRFTRRVRERTAIEPDDRIGQPKARRFEVAWHAYIDLSIRAESSRVDDRFSYLLFTGARRRQIDVPAARTVAPLAIDTLRYTLRKYRFGSRFFALRSNCWNCIVAEHATVSDGA